MTFDICFRTVLRCEFGAKTFEPKCHETAYGNSTFKDESKLKSSKVGCPFCACPDEKPGDVYGPEEKQKT